MGRRKKFGGALSPNFPRGYGPGKLLCLQTSVSAGVKMCIFSFWKLLLRTKNL